MKKAKRVLGWQPEVTEVKDIIATAWQVRKLIHMDIKKSNRRNESMTTSQMIADFTTLAIQAGGWMELDRLYLQNRLLSMIGEQN